MSTTVTLPSLYEPFLGFAALFVCLGFGMLYFSRTARSDVGPGYWATSFFLNSAGFMFWAGTITSRPWSFFTMGEALHMLGFITLVCGAYRFAGNSFQRWNIYALTGFALVWVVAMILMQQHYHGSFFLLMALRAVLFIWAGRMILKPISTNSLTGRRLAGWGLITWGIYIFLFPFIWQLPWLLPLAFGFLVGFHVLAGMGMMVLIVDRMRIRAETSEKHAQRLEGLLPICASCKRIRDDKGCWNQIEDYIQMHSDATFSHGMCPKCSDELYGKEDWYMEMKKAE